MAQCPTQMRHRDSSTSQCVLPRDHILNDSDHQDAHGCTAHVLVHQASIDEVRRWQDIPFPWERQER